MIILPQAGLFGCALLSTEFGLEFPNVPLSSCVILGKLPNLSVPVSSHVK